MLGFVPVAGELLSLIYWLTERNGTYGFTTYTNGGKLRMIVTTITPIS
jgi:hypothetical protein